MFITFFVIFLILGLLIILIDEYNGWMILSIIWLVLIIAAIIFMATCDTVVYEEVIKIPIYSLEDNRDIHGSFALGSGTINASEYFYYFVEDNNKLKFVKADAQRVKIQEVDANTAYEVYVIKHMSLTGIAFTRRATGWTNSDCDYLEVPKDTVIKKYNIDLQ